MTESVTWAALFLWLCCCRGGPLATKGPLHCKAASTVQNRGCCEHHKIGPAALQRSLKIGAASATGGGEALDAVLGGKRRGWEKSLEAQLHFFLIR